MSIIEQTKAKMVAALEHLKHELKNIRTGRANPAMLDGIHLEVYGTEVRLKDIASISAPEPRQLLVTPFDSRNAGAIAKAIEKANLGIQPIHDGNVVRIKIPFMDEAVRKEMVKLCHKKREESKVGIRNVRQEANKTIKQQKANGDIPEDMMKKFEKGIQELTDKSCVEADDICTKKEKEITTI